MNPDRGQPPRRRRVGRAAFVALIVVAVVIVALEPPTPVAIPPADWPTSQVTVRGAYHIHSNRSDGAGTIDDVASAASRAGLDFIILTDHGDGTRPPEPPSYRHGVLCLDGVELNTDHGHYVALGLGAAPYPLAGSAESVVEDVSRFGGFGLAAHADSARASLRWRAWDVPFDALEWLNIDSEWRDESWAALTRGALTYWLQPAATLASLLDRRDDLMSSWDRLTRVRRVPVLAAADAHARLAIQQRTDPDNAGWYLPMPSYESSFRAFSNHVVLDGGFRGEAPTDAERVLTAIRQGRVFTVIDGLAGPGAFEYTGTSGDQVATLGDDLRLDGQASLQARVAAPAGASLVLLRDGQVVEQTTESELAVDVAEPGAYRVEVALRGSSSLPWLLSNPIYVGFDRTAAPNPPTPVRSELPVALGEARSESSEGSSTELQINSEITWRYRMASGIPAGQYSAIRLPVTGLRDATRVRFDASADRPMRFWVQIRRPGGVGERWGRTVYVDQANRSIDLLLETFAPIGVTMTTRAVLQDVDSLLFVVDTVNTTPGSSGVVRLAKVGFAR